VFESLYWVAEPRMSVAGTQEEHMPERQRALHIDDILSDVMDGFGLAVEDIAARYGEEGRKLTEAFLRETLRLHDDDVKEFMAWYDPEAR
jgi:hypothetical protein